MSDAEPVIDDERNPWSPWAIAAAVVLLLVCGVIAAGTVRGCFFADPTQTSAEDDVKKKKEEEEKKKKGDFTIESPIVMPSEPKVPLPVAKPGHWQTTSQTMTANFRDFVGDSRVSITNNQEQPYPIARTPFTVRTNRPVLLTKARPKTTETIILVPEVTQQAFLLNDLEERGIGFRVAPIRTPLTPMPSYEYHFVVLAKEPSRYGFVKSLDSVIAPFDGIDESDDTQDPVLYHVTLLTAGQTVALPDNPLTWTSTAYMLWDEVDPGDPITPDQEKAIVDWIQWGGQLIVNGPTSLDMLKGSFLEPYLPATNEGPRKIGADDPAIAELNAHWMITTSRNPGEPLRPTTPWSAIKLKPHAEAKPLPNTGGLFVERQIGRGRIVVSAVQISERDLINWRSGFQSLFNACLLRRPPRKYIPGQFGDVTLVWADDALKDRRLDASLNTNLRWLSRDLGVATAYHYEHVDDGTGQNALQAGGPSAGRFGGSPNPAQLPTYREYRPPGYAGGLGAWNDFSDSAKAARTALREAAGVEVPGADFVVLCLAAYLTALVPLNWLIFRALGRVEWAWIAAPVIAIAGTWVIVERAQLDIGFVRAHTEVAVLEQQPEHPRAHLSRFTALYTSLSTTYDFQSLNATSLFAPFPSSADDPLLYGQGLTPVNFQRYDDVRLVGLPISSNSTGMVHSEQMQTLEGPIRLGKSTALGSLQIENRTKMELHSACVIRKPTAEETRKFRRGVEGRWIGELLPGQSAPTTERMSTLPDKDEKGSYFDEERRAEANLIRAARLNLEPMFKLALDPKYLEEGETRLVARCDEVLAGETITPEASQVRGATLVVVHLSYAPLGVPRKDFNTRRDIKATDNPENELEL